jgi:exodeoxyribonuclease-3
MRIMTLNANGIRAAERKGFFQWLPQQHADVVGIQETKAQTHQLEGKAAFWPRGYYCYYEDATAKKGYSGVALYAAREPDEVIRGLGFEEFDPEGRYVEARFGALSVISLYLPSGSSGDVRLQAKYRFMALFMAHLERLAKDGRDYVICGDWNIAHKAIDLKNWRSNQKNSGFLPEEREWLSEVFDRVGLVDAFRVVDDRPERYTWWSNRGRAWDNNTGWRLDYQIVSPSLGRRVKSADIYTNERFSDHAPLTLDYDYALE